MVDQLLNEFNPEIAEIARKELDRDITEMKEDGWYSNANLRNYLFKVSEPAQRVLGKKMVYAAGEAFDEIVESFENPVDLIKFTVENDPKEDFKKENWYKTQVLDAGDDFVTLKLDSDGFPAFYEGVYLGMLEKCKIIRTHIKTKTEHVDGLEISTLEIKWQ
ncbi:MAG: hypothetical protein ACFFDL_09750 [Promethearchaeota archaeon]